MPKKSSDKFPGFAQCMAMIRKRKTMSSEEAYFWLLPRVREYVEPLLAELETEQDVGVQSYIIELLAYARSVRALPVFLKHLSNPNQWVRVWAEHGLRDLKHTSEGRKVLWDLYWRQTPPPIPLSAGDERLLHETLARILRPASHDPCE